MKKFTKVFDKRNGGGVLALSSILALSLMFASCANNSDSNDRNPENSSPELPENVGETPIQNKITLKHSDYATLVMKTDDTAEYYDDGELEYVFKYTWNTTKQEIYMALEKMAYWNMGGESQLLTYGQTLSKLTIAELKNMEMEWYETIRDDEDFKDDYPNCESYEDFEKLRLEKFGYENFDEYFKDVREESLKELNEIFGVMITCKYEVNENGKITLTEKFTGIKNFLLYEECYYEKDGTRVKIEFGKEVSISREVNGKREYWYGEFGTGNRIEFEEEYSGAKKTGSYTEDIAKETVTVNFNGKEYVCEFEGKNFIQADD